MEDSLELEFQKVILCDKAQYTLKVSRLWREQKIEGVFHFETHFPGLDNKLEAFRYLLQEAKFASELGETTKNILFELIVVHEYKSAEKALKRAIHLDNVHSLMNKLFTEEEEKLLRLTLTAL